MSSVITVFGATGKQGGSVIGAIQANALLAQTWTIRAVTRDASKPAAQALAKHDNVQVVTANMDNKAEVQKAIEGASAVFAVTNFWDNLSKKVEMQQAKTMVDAAKRAGVKRYIWSSLPSASRLSNGVLSHVDHFDGKAEVEDYVESIKKPDMVAVYVQPGFYMSNFESALRDDDQTPGGLVFASPFGDGDKTQVPLADIGADYGKFVASVLDAAPAEVDGKRIQAVSEWSTPNGAMAAIAKQVGKPVRYQELDPEVYDSFMPNETIGRELKENMLLIRDYSYYGNDAKAKQAESDACLLKGFTTTSFADYLRQSSKWRSS